jgi:hypothetical protein
MYSHGFAHQPHMEFADASQQEKCHTNFVRDWLHLHPIRLP